MWYNCLIFLIWCFENRKLVKINTCLRKNLLIPSFLMWSNFFKKPHLLRSHESATFLPGSYTVGIINGLSTVLWEVCLYRVLKEACYRLLNKCFSVTRSKPALIWGTICAYYCRAKSEFISKIALNLKSEWFCYHCRLMDLKQVWYLIHHRPTLQE